MRININRIKIRAFFGKIRSKDLSYNNLLPKKDIFEGFLAAFFKFNFLVRGELCWIWKWQLLAIFGTIYRDLARSGSHVSVGRQLMVSVMDAAIFQNVPKEADVCHPNQIFYKRGLSARWARMNGEKSVQQDAKREPEVRSRCPSLVDLVFKCKYCPSWNIRQKGLSSKNSGKFFIFSNFCQLFRNCLLITVIFNKY